MSATTQLSRKGSEHSSLDLEKTYVKQSEHVEHPPTITEEDERNHAGLHEYLEGADLEITPKINRTIRWKTDLVILPMFLITQALQFLDKTALNYANILGFQDDLNLKGLDFNYLSAMVYAGYFFGMAPANYLIGRFKTQYVMGIACLLWGFCVVILTQCTNYSQALAVRFIMGWFEAFVTPCLTLMTGFWYTRREIPLRQCIWFSSLGFGGLIGSYMTMGITTMNNPSWKILFYILGGVTMLWSVVLGFILPDNPANAWFLKKNERVLGVKRVAQNDVGIKSKDWQWYQVWAAFKDPKVILLFISVFGAAIPNGVVNSFSTIIIKDMGFGTTRTTQLKSVGDGVQIVALLIAGTIILNVRNSRLLVASGANITCVVAACCLAYISREHTWQRLISFWIVNSQSVGFTVSLVTISSNMGGYTKRSVASAIIFSGYCWGNFAGPFVVKPSQAPRYEGASKGLIAGYAIKMVTHAMLLCYCIWWNRRRNKKYGPPNQERAALAGMEDKTEFENIDFRYVL